MTRYTKFVYPIAFALTLWVIIIELFDLPKYILPGPLDVADSFWKSRWLILEHTYYTASEVVIGILIGVSIGVITALAIAYSESVRLFVQPLLLFSQVIPVFALAPLLTLWLGYGLSSKVAMAVLIIYFPVTISFYNGLIRTPPGYLDLATTMNASKSSKLWHIQVPNAIPSLCSGLQLAAVYAPIGAVIGEWVGSSKGLGYLMLLANGRAKTDLMFSALLMLGVLTIALHGLMSYLTTQIKLRVE